MCFSKLIDATSSASFDISPPIKFTDFCESNNKERPRQKLPKVYIRNGAIYISKVKFFKKKRVLTDSKSVPYLMGNTESINIDGPIDLELAKALLK